MEKEPSPWAPLTGRSPAGRAAVRRGTVCGPSLREGLSPGVETSRSNYPGPRGDHTWNIVDRSGLPTSGEGGTAAKGHRIDSRERGVYPRRREEADWEESVLSGV